MKGDPIFVFITCIHIFSFEWIVIHEWVIFVIPFYWWVHLSGSYPHSGLLYFNSFSLEIARIKLQSLHNFYSPINSCLQKVADIAQKMLKTYTRGREADAKFLLHGFCCQWPPWLPLFVRFSQSDMVASGLFKKVLHEDAQKKVAMTRKWVSFEQTFMLWGLLALFHSNYHAIS